MQVIIKVKDQEIESSKERKHSLTPLVGYRMECFSNKDIWMFVFYNSKWQSDSTFKDVLSMYNDIRRRSIEAFSYYRHTRIEEVPPCIAFSELL